MTRYPGDRGRQFVCESEACLRSMEDGIAAMQADVDGRFSRALTIIDKSRGELRAHLGKVAGGLTSLQLAAPSEDPAQVAAAVET